MAGIFSKLFSKKINSIVGIDFGSSAIKVVQLEKKEGRAVLKTYGELALGPYHNVEIGRSTKLTTPKLTEALRDIMRESKVTTRNAGIAIPLSVSLVRTIHLPNFDPKQFQEVVSIEARKYIPVPIDEVTLSWWEIPSPKGVAIDQNLEKKKSKNPAGASGISMMIGAIHNEAIQKYTTIAKNSELNSRFIEIEAFSSMRAIVEDNKTTTMMFDFGAGTTKLYIIDGGTLVSSHTINRGSQDITISMAQSLGITVEKAEMSKRTIGLNSTDEHRKQFEVISLVLIHIFSEANKFLNSFEKKSGKRIQNIVMTGGGSMLNGLIDVAKTSFSIPVSLANPFSKVQSPAFLDDVLKKVGPEFSVSVGVALRTLQDVE